MTGWSRSLAVAVTFLAKIPAPILDPRMCSGFNCPGMLKVLERINGPKVAMSSDVKQGCMQHGHGVATLSISGKDVLRNTTLARVEGKRVRGVLSPLMPILG